MRTASDGHVFEPANWPQGHLCKWCFEPVAPHLTATHNPGTVMDLPNWAKMADHPHQPNGREPMYCTMPGCEMTQAQHPERVTPALPRVIWQGERLRVVEVDNDRQRQFPAIRNEAVVGMRRFNLERKGAPDAMGIVGWGEAERVTPDECVEAILSLAEGEGA